jgi:hypothetical protein
VGGDDTQPFGHVQRRAFALHPGVAFEQCEADATAFELGGEVGVGGGADAGDEAHPQGRERDGQPGVAVQQSVVGECPEEPVAFGGELPEGERRVDGGHVELEATPRRVEAQVGPQAEHEVVLECEAAGGGERALDARPVALPEGHAEEGGGRRPRLVDRLDQVEVGVARSGVVEVGDLALHPQVAGEQRADALADQFGQFGHGQDRQVGVRMHADTVRRRESRGTRGSS